MALSAVERALVLSAMPLGLHLDMGTCYVQSQQLQAVEEGFRNITRE